MNEVIVVLILLQHT